MNSLPLSWSINSNSKFIQTVKHKNICWISYGSLNKDQDFYSTIDSFCLQKKNDLIIRGCDSTITNYLENKGFNSIKVGSEAVLDTTKDLFKKKSLMKLVKRGFNKGKIEKFNFSIENKLKLEEFIKISKHSREPQLQNLFLTEFKSNHLLYVLSRNEEWLGAILISQNSETKIHTELILRKENSPVGTLEAIIYQIYEDAKLKNIPYVSLGEVPFISKINFLNDGFYTSIIILAGKTLKFAYNYKGLRNFKNKFNPTWQPIYICISHKISLKHFIFLFIQTNFYRLMFFKLVYRLKIL
jgi:lysylphosphatidylglycerol synthetase-like protein (DUF2156 family)